MADKQKILVIGATGFVGTQVLAQLAKRDDVEVSVMLRKHRTPPQWDGAHPLMVLRGDLNDQVSMQVAMLGKDGLIYVASLGFGHTAAVVAAATKAKLKRAVFTSTTAIFTKLNAPSKVVRTAAEKTITDSKLNYTIIRPTMIYGRKGDRNMERLVKYLRKVPILFIPGNGKSLQQPNHVDDVASAVISAYFCPKAARKAYNISGAQPLSFNQVVQTTAAALGKKVWLIHLPLAPICWVLRQLEKLIPNLRIKEEQLLRLNENKAFDHAEAAADFGYTPLSFAQGISKLVKQLQK